MASWEDLNRLKGVFNRFDTDQNGALDRHEFGEFLAAIGKGFSPAEVDEGFAEIDADGSGVVDFSEFVDWWETRD